MSFRLRPYKEPDFETLWQIDQRCFLPGVAYSKRELDLFLRRSGAVCLVAEEDGNEGKTLDSGNPDSGVNPHIFGFVIVHLHHQKATAHVITIDVLSRARRLGVGTALMAAAEKRALDRSCTVMHLEAAVENESALAFYARHGYTIMRTVPDYYAPGAHAYTMTKPLA